MELVVQQALILHKGKQWYLFKVYCSDHPSV